MGGGGGGGEQVLQGLQGEGDCVCVRVGGSRCFRACRERVTVCVCG